MVSPSAYGRQGLSTMFTYALYVVRSRSCEDASDLKLRSGLNRWHVLLTTITELALTRELLPRPAVSPRLTEMLRRE